MRGNARWKAHGNDRRTSLSRICSALWIAGIAACGGGVGGGDGGGGDGGGGAGAGPVACADHPLDCPAEQTCWFLEGDTFGCLTSGSGAEGDACSPLVGQPTCGAALLCVKKAGQDEGTCTKLCEPTTGEPCGDLLCVPVQLASGEQTYACQ